MGVGVRLRVALVAAMAALVWGCAVAPLKKEAESIFFPPPPERPRIQYLTRFAHSKDVGVARVGLAKFVLGSEGEKYDELKKPYGVAIRDGKIYVADTKLNMIAVMDLVKKDWRMIGGDRRTNFVKPVNLVTDKDGNSYVADSEGGRVVVLDAEGKLVRSFGDKERWRPTDVAIYKDFLYVIDLKDHEIEVVDKLKGDLVYRIGKKGEKEGELLIPTNIAVDQEGNIFVADTGNFRIQKLSRDGSFIRSFGSIGDAVGRFHRPRGIAVDRQGRLYAVDAAFDNVQIFDPLGRVLLFFGGPGHGPGELNLPAKVVIDYENVGLFKKYADPNFELEYLIIVTSQFGPGKVTVYGFGHPKGAAASGEES